MWHIVGAQIVLVARGHGLFYLSTSDCGSEGVDVEPSVPLADTKGRVSCSGPRSPVPRRSNEEKMPGQFPKLVFPPQQVTHLCLHGCFAPIN